MRVRYVASRIPLVTVEVLQRESLSGREASGALRALAGEVGSCSSQLRTNLLTWAEHVSPATTANGRSRNGCSEDGEVRVRSPGAEQIWVSLDLADFYCAQDGRAPQLWERRTASPRDSASRRGRRSDVVV